MLRIRSGGYCRAIYFDFLDLTIMTNSQISARANINPDKVKSQNMINKA